MHHWCAWKAAGGQEEMGIPIVPSVPHVSWLGRHWRVPEEQVTRGGGGTNLIC